MKTNRTSGESETPAVAVRQRADEAKTLEANLTGLPVVTDVKAREPSTLVLVLTSYPYPQCRQAYQAAGADCPYDKAKDIQSMNDVLVELAKNQ
jgi:hypothetical protein